LFKTPSHPHEKAGCMRVRSHPLSVSVASFAIAGTDGGGLS
jgi:hypothetical protein